MNRSFHFNGHVIELNSDGEPFTPLGRLQRQFHPDEFKKAVAALQDNGNAPLVGGLIPDASPAPTPSSGTKSATLKSKPAVSKPTAQTKSQTTRGNSNGSHTPETDEAAYKRLAELTLGQYDRVREAEAGSLGIKPGTLDKEVQAIQEALRQLNLSRKLARWLKDNSDKLPSSPQLPRGLINRPADNWMPLFAIAELAGGDWPGRCLVAFHLIHHPENDPKSERTQLLSNLRPFIAEAVETGEEFMATEHILSFLNSEPELGYSVKLRGHPVHDKWLAAQMDTIKSTKFRPEEEGGKQVRGYSVAAIWDEIERYAPVKSEAEEDSERVDL